MACQQDPSAPPPDASDHGQARRGPLSLIDLEPDWAWARYEPSAQNPWMPKLAAHLFRRTGFGSSWSELQKALAKSPHATIDEVLTTPDTYAAFASEFDAHESAAARSSDGMVFGTWWLRRLHESPWPLVERMTLFWHGYFAIRSSKVADIRVFHAHIQLLRRKALSDFPSLLEALAGDAAMYAGLDGEQNRKARPNLHFARPWLEVFTVGPTTTTPSNISALARAWTGWFVYGGKLRFIDREHDSGPKELLGRKSNWERDDAIQFLALQPATAITVARRLYREFISESASPPDGLLAPLTRQLQRNGSIGEALELLLRSNLFFSEYAVGQCVKSPVELAVGLARSLNGRFPSGAIGEELVNLGQRLDEPPTVHGWDGGEHWINTLSLAGRVRLCRSLANSSGPYGACLDPARVAAAHGFNAPEDQARFLIDLFMPGQVQEAEARRILKAAAGSPEPARAVLELVTQQPEFQLK